MKDKRSAGQVPNASGAKSKDGDVRGKDNRENLRETLDWTGGKRRAEERERKAQPPQKQNRADQTPNIYDLEQGRQQGQKHSREHGHVSRPLRLLVFFIGIGLLMLGLSIAFPATKFGDPYLIRGLLVAGIFGGIMVFYSRSSIMRIAKAAGAWIAIIMLLAGFYLFNSNFSSDFAAAFMPGYVAERGDGALVIKRAEDGHFWIRTTINGATVPMMIDTGASNVVLSPADAKRAGINTAALRFNNIAATANGDVTFATTKVDTLELGTFKLVQFPVTVNGTAMQGSLLGLRLMNEFSSYEVSGDTMILKP